MHLILNENQLVHLNAFITSSVFFFLAFYVLFYKTIFKKFYVRQGFPH